MSEIYKSFVVLMLTAISLSFLGGTLWLYAKEKEWGWMLFVTALVTSGCLTGIGHLINFKE